ncbi:MAG: lipid II flippase MurJ [Candidatus Omnitrophota bacterium]|nr:lipid II flippase MurJ [Candidatus Omnitrophota bacterium]
MAEPREKRPFLSTSLLTLIGRAGGMVLPIVIGYFYGAGSEADAFFFAYAVILTLVGLFMPVFEAMLVPILAEYRSEPEKVASLSNGLLILSLPFVAAVFILVGVLLGPILQKGSGFGTESISLVTGLFWEMAPLYLFGITVAASNSVFYTHRLFWFPALSPVFRAACVIGSIFFGHVTGGVHAIVWGLSLGEFVRWILGLGVLFKQSLWRWFVGWKEIREKARGFFKQAAYQSVAFLALHLVFLTDQWFAAWLGEGKLSLISYANRLFQIPHQLALAGFLQIFLTSWSHKYHDGSKKEFRLRVVKDIRIVCLVTLLISLVLFLLRGPIVRTLYGFGGLSGSDLEMVSSLFGWLMFGFTPIVVNLLFVRVLFVLQKSVVFCVQAWMQFFLNIVLNWLLVSIYGLQGIAIATTAVSILMTLGLLGYLKFHWKSSELEN